MFNNYTLHSRNKLPSVEPLFLDYASNVALSQEGVLSVKHIQMFLHDALKEKSLPWSKTFTLTPNAYMVRFLIQQCTVIFIMNPGFSTDKLGRLWCACNAQH